MSRDAFVKFLPTNTMHLSILNDPNARELLSPDEFARVIAQWAVECVKDSPTKDFLKSTGNKPTMNHWSRSFSAHVTTNVERLVGLLGSRIKLAHPAAMSAATRSDTTSTAKIMTRALRVGASIAVDLGDFHELNVVFDSLDDDGDGQITKQDLWRLGIPQDIRVKLSMWMDLDGDGTISRTEWPVAMQRHMGEVQLPDAVLNDQVAFDLRLLKARVDLFAGSYLRQQIAQLRQLVKPSEQDKRQLMGFAREHLNDENKLRGQALFRAIDLDGDQRLSPTDLAPDQAHKFQWLLGEFDLNSDGVIHRDEFEYGSLPSRDATDCFSSPLLRHIGLRQSPCAFCLCLSVISFRFAGASFDRTRVRDRPAPAQDFSCLACSLQVDPQCKSILGACRA